MRESDTSETLREVELRQALEKILDAVDDLRLVNRLKEIERIAVEALVSPALKTAEGKMG